MGEIAEPKAGESTFALWKTVAALAVAVNPLKKIEIKPTGKGKVVYSDANVVLDLDMGGEIAVAVDDDMDDFLEGETAVDKIKTISFSSLFKIHDDGGGTVQVTLNTQECDCSPSFDGGEL